MAVMASLNTIEGRPTLYIALIKKNFKFITALLETGADPRRNYSIITPKPLISNLMSNQPIRAWLTNTEIYDFIKLLVRYGADINSIDDVNFTLLDYCNQYPERIDPRLQRLLTDLGARTGADIAPAAAARIQREREEREARAAQAAREPYDLLAKLQPYCCRDIVEQLKTIHTNRSGILYGFRTVHVGKLIKGSINTDDDVYLVYGHPPKQDLVIGKFIIVGGKDGLITDIKIQFLDIDTNTWRNFNWETKAITGGNRKTRNRNRSRMSRKKGPY